MDKPGAVPHHESRNDPKEADPQRHKRHHTDLVVHQRPSDHLGTLLPSENGLLPYEADREQGCDDGERDSQ
jgi:hypothetical protein